MATHIQIPGVPKGDMAYLKKEGWLTGDILSLSALLGHYNSMHLNHEQQTKYYEKGLAGANDKMSRIIEYSKKRTIPSPVLKENFRRAIVAYGHKISTR